MNRWAKSVLKGRRLVPAIATLAISSTVVNAADITGKWDSNQGPMTITKESDGTYAVTFKLVEGKVTGNLDQDGVFKGIWIRETSQETCQTKKDGSPYWGGFKVTFYTPEIFQGYMSWCTEDIVSGQQVENWTGARAK